MTAQPVGTDPVLDVALERVRELSLRLWAVREAHPPVRSRLGRARCGGCGGAWPCATLRAAGMEHLPEPRREA